MSAFFRLKKFEVDQRGCAMKINTDGVLLGAIADANSPQHILDIGTGTGIIALMLAQRYPESHIDAVEIDELTAQRADENFGRSSFKDRMTLIHSDFKDFTPRKAYDLIVSNPPYFLNSLKNMEARKAIARHSSVDLFNELLEFAHRYLKPEGMLTLILPIAVLHEIKNILKELQGLHLCKEIFIRSFKNSPPIRIIVCIKKIEEMILETTMECLTIYDSRNEYTHEYRSLLKDFFLAF